MQHFGEIGFHSGPLASGKDDQSSAHAVFLSFQLRTFYPVAEQAQDRNPSKMIAGCDKLARKYAKPGVSPMGDRVLKTVVFDLDGTLADTSGDLIAAANACFQGLGVGDLLDPVRDASTALRGGRAMLKLGLGRIGRGEDTDEIDRQYPVLLAAYEKAIDVHTVFYPGALDAVDVLKVDGYRVSICTNKPEYLARLLLRRLGVLDQFGALIGADTLSVRKPDPEPLFEAVRRAGGAPELCLLVGDTQTDHDTARAAGVPSVLVNFGPNGPIAADLEPDAMIDGFAELPDVVLRLIGPARV